MLENIQLALQGIWGHKLRSFLTMLGIIIGIASIITIVSTIKGTNEQIKENLIGSGTNALTVQVYMDGNPYEMDYASNPAGVSPISQETRDKLSELDYVAGVSLFHSRSYVDGVYYADTQYTGNIYGVDDQYLSVNGYRLHSGRGFLPSDFTSFRKVIILDQKAASSLFGGASPIGQTIEIKAQPFTIIGVVEPTETYTPVINTIDEYYTYADTTSGRMFVPDPIWPVIYRYDEPHSVSVKATNTDDMTRAGKNVADYLTENQISDPTGKLTYQSMDLQEQAQQLQSISNSTNRQLIWIASISLLVGGIGVMNIMLVSVTERTSEIGLKKAIGARKRRIRAQFLTEAAVLTSFGGILGVVAGIVLAKLISRFMATPTSISVPAILVAVLFSMVIGVVFGLLPATKASNLNPIDALRRE